MKKRALGALIELNGNHDSYISFILVWETIFSLNTFLGDPSVFGNLDPCNEMVDSVVNCIKKAKHNGYSPSTGDFTQRTE